jgi:ABC-2 type transport system ATP-binding protein
LATTATGTGGLTQYVSGAEECDRVGLLSNGELVAVGTPQQLRREAFGGETIVLTQGGDTGHAAEHLSALERVGHVVEVLAKDDDDETTSLARLVVDDADISLPMVFEVLNGADVRSADVLTPSFDEVFFRLVSRKAEDS